MLHKSGGESSKGGIAKSGGESTETDYIVFEIALGAMPSVLCPFTIYKYLFIFFSPFRYIRKQIPCLLGAGVKGVRHHCPAGKIQS